uniref:Ribosomal protein mS38 C-terminal domain-containing protein n=1 Tax=Phlebotomus papatasi TaxID=29031 RepID=A0A1B0D4X6_PHLPP
MNSSGESYGATSLVENFANLTLGRSSVASRKLATASRDTREPCPVERFWMVGSGNPLSQLRLPLRNPLKEIRDVPKIPINIIEPPGQRMLTEINSIVREEREIKLPEMSGIVEKHAVRLIVIRRKKMKKHKLRKLRKKMKYEWAKVRQRREMRKEKAFRAEIFAQIKEAENFSAEKYVEEKLRKATETPIPRFWKNRRLPQFIIKQKLGIK